MGLCRAKAKCCRRCGPQVLAANRYFTSVVANSGRYASGKGDPFEAIVVASLYRKFGGKSVGAVIKALASGDLDIEVDSWVWSTFIPSGDVVFARHDEIGVKSDIEFISSFSELPLLCDRPKISVGPGKSMLGIFRFRSVVVYALVPSRCYLSTGELIRCGFARRIAGRSCKMFLTQH
jgi:hypothetical protein